MFGCDFDYFNELNSLLTDPNTPIPIIFNVENFRGAFRKENTKLCQYILLHITDVVDYAFGLIKNDENCAKIQSNALYILTTQTSSFSKQLTTHRTYLLKLMSFIKKDEPIDKFILTTFCFIFQFMIKLTDGFIFIHLPEKDKFISRLSSHILHNSIYDFLIFLSTSQNQVVIDYLTNSQAVMKLLLSVDDKPETSTSILINKRKFNILSNIVKNSKASFLPDQISRKNTLEFIITYSISKQCSNSFIFLSNIWDFYQYKKVLNSLPQIIKSMSDDFVNFILNDTHPFNRSKNIALSLLSRSIISQKFLTDKIIEMAEKLWDLFFKNPSYSMLHEAFLNFVKSAISADPKFIEKVEIREKIVEAYSKRKTVTATYWGHLHLMTALIIRTTELKSQSKSNEIKSLPEFDQYVESVFMPIEKSLENGYGGNLPKRSNIAEDDAQASFCPSISPYGTCNASILNYIKHRFHSISNDRTQSSDSYGDDEEEEEEEDIKNKNKSSKNGVDDDDDDENSASNDDSDENESSNAEESESSCVDDSESDRFFSMYDFQQLKAEPNLVVDEPISLKLQGNLFVKKVPKKIVFGRGGLIIGISSEFSLEIFKFPDFSRINTRNFDTSLLSFTFSEDESQYFCCFFNKIIVFNLLDSTMSRAYCIEKCQKIVMHDNSSRFCTFHDDGRIKAFKLPQNIEIASFKNENYKEMVDATFSIDGLYIGVGYKSGKISLFDIDQKKLVKVVNACQVKINSLCFDSVNNYLFSAGDEKIFKKWRIDDDDLKYEMSFNCNGNVSAIDIKGKWLVAGSFDKTFSMTDIDNNKICYVVKSHSSPILCVAFASYKEMFATASKDMTVKIWTYQNSKK